MQRTISLIRPSIGGYRSSDALPPLSLGILAARTPRDISVRLFDDRLQAVPEDDMPDLAAITIETFTARRAYAIADQYRARGIPVVMGGYHATFLPDEILEHANSVVLGDAEGAWEQLLQDHFFGSGLRRKYTGDESRPLNDVRIDRNIFKGLGYPSVELTWFTRGCRFACDFCSIRAFYKSGARARSAADLVHELHELDNSKLLLFVDDNLFVSKDAFIEMLHAIKGLGFHWGCQISIDVARDEHMLDLMKEAGCLYILIGFESIVPDSLKQMGKRWNKVAGDYLQVVRKIRARDIGIYGTFVFGYDGDTVESMDETYAFAMEARLDIANFNPLTPTPGSALYDRLLKEGRLLKPQWWLDPQYRYGDAIFMPRKMEPMEFSQKCFELRSKFYSLRPIAGRFVRDCLHRRWKRSYLTLAANMISRWEILGKQHRDLGRTS